MAAVPVVAPSPELRAKLRSGSASRCYQCATCSSVCELAPVSAPFPRKQMLWAQWGLLDRLAADPGIWLCHQCNDCNIRCPRDAQPGDVLQTLRAAAVEHLAAPRWLGRLVGRARTTWPLLVGLPILIWIAILAVFTGLEVPAVNPDLPVLEGRFHYEKFVPHPLIYVVYSSISLWVVGAAWVSGRRFWALLGAGAQRSGSFLTNLVPAVVEISTHKRFGTCTDAPTRRWGHFGVMWGFVGAAVTSGFLVVYLYGFHMYPLPLDHWVKWLGNVSALALVVGGVLLLFNRARNTRQSGATTAFDRFFLWLVAAVIVTGVLTEAFRFLAEPVVACAVYVAHLGVVFTLFVTFPYSKFAHLLYRTLAMVHQLMVEAAAQARS
jgi:quinone-modifying oxidoreductase subunit QmoC